MKNSINKFCYKHPNFGISNLLKYLTIANVVFWIVGTVKSSVLSYMTFNPYLILHGQVWRIVSFVFIPPSSGILAFVAFYFYYFIGNTLERNWGTAKFNLYFFSGIILTVLYGFLMYFAFGYVVELNATYIYLSMFLSFAALFPDMQVLLFFIIPIKIKWLAIVDLVLFAMSVLSMRFPVNLLPIIAILNVFVFCGDDILRAFNINIKSKKQYAETVNFKKASAEIKREQRKNLYHHKCSVCGRTDTDYPELEFRYCSKCQGYHCFCQDHINNHIHFTE